METNSLYHNELALGDYQPRVVAYYFKQWDVLQMPFHTHNAVEIMYVISGKCVVHTAQELFPLKKGDFILLDAEVPHRLVVEEDSPCRMLNVEFTFTAREGAYPSIRDLTAANRPLAALLAMESPFLVLKDPNEVYHILKSLVLELDERGIENEMMVQLLLSQLLIRIARLAVESADTKPQQAHIYVRNTMEYIHHHYDCNIQVKDIASAVNLHPGYLHRIFKANMDCSVMEYLTLHRVEKAKMLLAHTDIPVIEISEYIGINSRQYFSTIFKKHTGKTPVEFRQSVDTQKWNYA